MVAPKQKRNANVDDLDAQELNELVEKSSADAKQLCDQLQRSTTLESIPPDVILRELKTEPMTIRELARHFEIGRNTMSLVLRKMNGAERCGNRWRVPLLKMPPAYLQKTGILPTH